MDSYPLPKIEDLYAKFSGGKIFTSLDLRHAYEELPPCFRESKSM